MVTPHSTQFDAAHLKQRVDLRDIIAEELGPGKRSGNTRRWRDGSRRNTSLAAGADWYKNHRTGEGGDVFGWYQHRHGMSRPEAIAYVHERVNGISSPLPTRIATLAVQTAHNEPPPAGWQSAARQEIARACRLLQQPSAAHARKDLNDRGITDELIEKLQLGFNPYWRRTGYKDHEGHDTWLAPGIVIPCIIGGVVWGLHVRLLDRRAPDGSELPKYMYMTGSKATGALYNGDAVQPGRDVLFVEGEFDCMLAQRLLGDRVAVVTLASASNALPSRWVKLLRAAGNLYALLDNDAAGQAATDQLRATLGAPLRVLRLPAGKDVTEFWQTGGDIGAWFDRAIQSEDETDAQPYEAPGTLRFWETVPLVIVCPEYVLIQLHTRAAGIGDDFTAAQLAERAGISKDKSQTWINRALEWELVGPAADLQGKESSNCLTCKTAARHYQLTPEQGLPLVSEALPRFLMELMERPDPGVVRQGDAKAAGLDETTAAQVETITEVVTASDRALEVSADAERRAWAKAQEIERWAELDDTPFTPGTLPVTVHELRIVTIETLYETNPQKDWLHREFALVAGVKKGSVSALIAKSDKIISAPNPSFKDFPIEGRVTARAAGRIAQREGGAPVGWLNAAGQVIGPFSSRPPNGATGIRVNCGKRYYRRADAPAAEPSQLGLVAATPPEPIDRDVLAQRRARALILPCLRGCLVARGWKYYPGPYGYWERGRQEQPNTFEGIVSALLEDFAWASA